MRMRHMRFATNANFEKVSGRGPVATTFNPDKNLLHADDVKHELYQIPDTLARADIFTGITKEMPEKR